MACSLQPLSILPGAQRVRPLLCAWGAISLAVLPCLVRCDFLDCFRCHSGTNIFQCWGRGVGLPLLAIAATQPTSAIASQKRYAWIFLVIAAAAGTLLVYVVQFKLWTSLCAIAAALAILVHGIRQKRLLLTSAGLSLMLTLLAFATKMQVGNLLPGDILHLGLTLTLALLIL